MQNTAIFQTLHHVCIVVHDIEKSVAFYESVGVGPWRDFPPLTVFKEVDVPDYDAFLNLKYKFANIGNLQIQLCQPGEGKSAQKIFLDTRGEGVFHLGFTVPDSDAAETEGEQLGLKRKMSARVPDSGGFTYFDTADCGAGVLLEVRAAKFS